MENEAGTLRFKVRVNFFPNKQSIILKLYEITFIVFLLYNLRFSYGFHYYLYLCIIAFAVYDFFRIVCIYVPFSATFKTRNGILFFNTFDYWFKGRFPAVEKYKIFNNKNDNNSLDLVLEVWFGKFLLVIREKIENNTHNDLTTYRRTNLGCTVRAVEPGTIDKIEAFINEFSKAENHENL